MGGGRYCFHKSWRLYEENLSKLGNYEQLIADFHGISGFRIKISPIRKKGIQRDDIS